jgi:putative tricarboxylic transport membrane protein
MIGGKPVQLGWKITSVLLGVLFALFLYQSTKLPLFDELGPGPGFFPLILGGLGMLLSVVLFVQVRARAAEFGADSEATAVSWKSRFRVAGVVVLMALAALVLERLGYTLTALVVIPLVLILLGARSPVAIILVSIALSVGVFHVFYHWLGVPLPIGLFGI